MSWFKRKTKGIQTSTKEKKDIPQGLWYKSPTGKIIETLLHGFQGAIRRNAGPPAPAPGAAGRAGRGLRACSAARGSKKRGSSSLTAWQMLCQIAKRTVRRGLRLAALYGQALDGCKAPGFCSSVRLAPTRRERFRNGSKFRGA